MKRPIDIRTRKLINGNNNDHIGGRNLGVHP